MNQRGGAERVVVEMATSVWPGAPIFTSLYRPESTFPEFKPCDIRTSFLDRAPVDGAFRALLPLYPAAFRSFGVFDQDVVVSSSSAWAHGIHTAPHSLHVVYCHTPARWLYMPGRYFSSGKKSHLLTPARRVFKWWDKAAAHRVDRYIANTQFVRDRIARIYGIEADVVHPPVDTKRFEPKPRGDRLLVVSRLLAYKRVDLAVKAANELGIGLDVVGIGPESRRLEAMAGPTVSIHGRLPDDGVRELFESCYALCLPGMEDFGITSVEALAAGKPVVAYRAGGALETLRDGVSAAMFTYQSVEQMVDAIRRLEHIDTSPAELAADAERFSNEAFRTNLLNAVERLKVEAATAA